MLKKVALYIALISISLTLGLVVGGSKGTFENGYEFALESVSQELQNAGIDSTLYITLQGDN